MNVAPLQMINEASKEGKEHEKTMVTEEELEEVMVHESTHFVAKITI